MRHWAKGIADSIHDQLSSKWILDRNVNHNWDREHTCAKCDGSRLTEVLGTVYASSNEIFIFIFISLVFVSWIETNFLKLKDLSIGERVFSSGVQFYKRTSYVLRRMIFEVFFNAKRVIKHGRYRVGNEYSVKHIRHIFNRFERIRWDARWNNVTLIVDRVYGPMNLLFNNRYVHFFFLFLHKHLSTRINRISFTILSNRKKVEIHDLGVSFISRKIICKKRGFIFSFLKCQYRAITIIFTFKNSVLMGKKKEKGNNTCFTKISRNSVQHL